MGISSAMGVAGLQFGVIADAAARPASPFEGQMVYEKDTDMVAIWNGTAWRYIAATTPTNGTVLQVVNATYSTTVANNTNVFADTGLTASITPKSSSSKILVTVNQNGCTKETGTATSVLILRLLRGSSQIAIIDQGAGYTGVSGYNWIGGVSISYLDSPATTSSTTYKTQFRNGPNAAGVQVQAAYTGGENPSMSSITLMEIAA